MTQATPVPAQRATPAGDLRARAGCVSGAVAIEARGIAAARGRRYVIRDLDLSICEGQTVALLGANGSGKSTLLMMLAGLLRPYAGQLSVLGHAIPGERWALRGRIGLVAHQPLLYRDLTIAENLHFHARLHRLPTGRADAMIERAGLESRADQPVYALSRGLTQRAAVCRALLHDPQLLLLDEPLANLDPVAAELIGELLGPEPGRTRVIAGHDPEAALAESDLVLVLGAGAKLRYAGPPSGVSVGELEAMYR